MNESCRSKGEILKKQRKNKVHAMYKSAVSYVMKGLVLCGRVIGFGVFSFLDFCFFSMLVINITSIIVESAVLSLAKAPLYMCIPWLAGCLFAVLVGVWLFAKVMISGKNFFFEKKEKQPVGCIGFERNICSHFCQQKKV